MTKTKLFPEQFTPTALFKRIGGTETTMLPGIIDDIISASEIGK